MIQWVSAEFEKFKNQTFKSPEYSWKPVKTFLKNLVIIEKLAIFKSKVAEIIKIGSLEIGSSWDHQNL